MADEALPTTSAFRVFVRWKPLLTDDTSTPTIQNDAIQCGIKNSISISLPSSTSGPATWQSGPSFARVFSTTTVNQEVYENVVAPVIPQVLRRATCNFFAYGHSGSGKTHTIIGYDYEDNRHLGLCLTAANHLFRALGEITTPELKSVKKNQTFGEETLGIAVRLYEVRARQAYDLLNNGIECHIREGADGQTHIRGPTETLEGGKVRVRPIVAWPCWSFEELRTTVLAGLAMRATGSSTIHDESSRTHAVLELEIVTKTLMHLREAVIERESELVPVGKRATDVYIEEQMKSLIRTADGKYEPNPDCPLDQKRIDIVEAEKKRYEDRLKEAEEAVIACFANSQHTCLGGKLVFVDLAGSEYFDRKVSPTATSVPAPKQTAQERQQGRQINTDLFSLKEVIRARAMNQTRVPYRASPLTMVLRSHFEGTGKGSSAMILTVASEEDQFAATMNTLKYGDLIGSVKANMERR